METSRVQLALNVSDIEAATRFYTDLFGVAPAKQRDGYANFEIADPPLKLVLFEHAAATSPLNHLGVEVASSDVVTAAADRFAAAGLSHKLMTSDRCCHAVRTRSGSTPPTSHSADGNSTPCWPTPRAPTRAAPAVRPPNRRARCAAPPRPRRRQLRHRVSRRAS